MSTIIETGQEVLPNGGVILSRRFLSDGKSEIVLCFLPHNLTTPYATWQKHKDDTFWGHYFTTVEEATEDFQTRGRGK